MLPVSFSLQLVFIVIIVGYYIPLGYTSVRIYVVWVVHNKFIIYGIQTNSSSDSPYLIK